MENTGETAPTEWMLNSCAYCGNTYRAATDPDWFDPWCSMECQNRTVK